MGRGYDRAADVRRRTRGERVTEKPTPREQMEWDLLISAVEGGIGYWSTCHSYRWRDDDGVDCAPSVVVVPDDEDPIVVTAADIAKAVRQIVKSKQDGEPIKFVSEDTYRAILDAVRDPENADNDAGVADQVFQLAALGGEIVYG